MPAGRPTDYTPELVQAAWAYIHNHDDDLVPSIAGLCDRINIDRSTAYDWAKDKDKEFSHILEAVGRKQEMALIKSGLNGEFNPTITKLMLTKHGYSDKQETEVKATTTVIINQADSNLL